MKLLIVFCDLSKRRLLISVMSSKGQGSIKRNSDTTDGHPEWSRCNSFSSSSNDSAIFCDSSSHKERPNRGTKRNRNSSGSSASSSLSYVSDKDNKKALPSNSVAEVGNSAIETFVGLARSDSKHNLRRNIIRKTCDCHCTETHTTYKRTSYERIEKKTSAKEITIARTNIQFRVENNGKKEVHKVTYKESYSPSKFDGNRHQSSEVEKQFCLQNNGTQEVHKVTYKESYSPKKSEQFCLENDGTQEFHKVTYKESYSPSKSDGNRKRRSEVQKLYESLHEIEWAKDFSPDNILRQIHVRQAASCSMFGRSKPGESPPRSAKRPKEDLDAKIESWSQTPVKPKKDLDAKSDSQSPPMPVKRLKLDLHDKSDSSSPPRLKEDLDDKSDSWIPPMQVQRPKEDLDAKSDSSELVETPPSLRSTRSSTLKNNFSQRKELMNSVVKYRRKRISRTNKKDSNSSIAKQNRNEDSNELNLIQSSVECFELKKNLGNLKIKKHINIKNSSMNCKLISSSQESIGISAQFGNNFELPNSLATLIPKMYQGPEADNMELASEYSLTPTFFDIAEEGIRTIDACFREVGAEVVISTCYEADSDLPLLTSVKDSSLSDKAAITNDCPPVLEHCGTCQAVDSKQFAEKSPITPCDSPHQTENSKDFQEIRFCESQTKDAKDCQLQNETFVGSCEVSYLKEDAKDFQLENETLAGSCESPDQMDNSKDFLLENETLARSCESPDQMDNSKDFQLESEISVRSCESPRQVDDSKDFKLENETLALSCENPDQVDNSKDFKLESETSVRYCEGPGHVDNFKDFQLENETLDRSCKSPDQVGDTKDFQFENEILARSCENPGQVNNSKDYQLENGTLVRSCEIPCQMEDSNNFQLENKTLVGSTEVSYLKEDTKDFQLENETLAKSCEESPFQMKDSKDCLSVSETLVIPYKNPRQSEDFKYPHFKNETFVGSCKSPCQTEDSICLQFQNETPIRTCENSYQIEDSKDGQIEKETLFRNRKKPIQIEDKNCQLQYVTLVRPCECPYEAGDSKDCQIKNENKTLVMSSVDPYQMEFSKDCKFLSLVNYQGEDFEEQQLKIETPTRSSVTYLGEGSKDLQFKNEIIIRPCQKEDYEGCHFQDESEYPQNNPHESFFNKQFGDPTDFLGVELNSSVTSETGTFDEESSDYENKSDLDSISYEESVEVSQKGYFSEILERIISNRCKNDSLIKQAGKRILNKYLRILRCKDRDEVSQQFYVSKKDISSPVKKKKVNSVMEGILMDELEGHKIESHTVVETSIQNLYLCKSQEKLTFNRSKSRFYTYSKKKQEPIHKTIPNKSLLIQQKNSNFYRKEQVETAHQPPKKEYPSNPPSVSRDKDIKIDRTSTLACHYQTLLVHRFNDYTQVILRLSHFTVENLSELQEVLCRTGRDPHCRTLILNGIGESFGLGLDLSPLLGSHRRKAAASIAHAVKDFIEALSAFKKPLVAVVNGAAHGLAMTVLNHADTIIASEKATFCMPQSRLGYFPEGGATFTLPRIVGSTVAMDLILRSRVITAQEALKINLITEVFEEKSIPLDLVSRVKVLLKNSLTGMETTKAMLKMHIQPELLTVLENEVKLLPQMWLSDSCQMAMARELCL